MSTCYKCKTENPNDSLYCRNCGNTLEKPASKKSGKKLFLRTLLIIALLGGVCWFIWFLSMPSYISARDTYIILEPTGDEKTVFVDTDADYDNWTVSSYSSWAKVEKTSYGVTISCDANNTDNARTATISLHTYGRYFYDSIELSQEPDNSIRGSIEKVWVDYNAYDEYDRSGIRIHVKFSVKKMKGIEGRCAAYFYDSENSTALNDYNGSYCTTDDKVSVGRSFTPRYDSSSWDDFILFIPDDELHLGAGKWNLYFNVRIFEEDKNKTICNSNEHKFSFNKEY